MSKKKIKKMSKKLNGYARWIIVVLALTGIAYNAVVSRVIVQNDLKHLTERVMRIEQKVDWLCEYLMEKQD